MFGAWGGSTQGGEIGMSDKPDRDTAMPGTARRRYLTMLFSDLSDSTAHAAAMEAENYAALLRELQRAYQEVVPRHGGTIVQIQGDGMLAIFGYPDAREDVGRRATEAALELHERVHGLRIDPAQPAGASLCLHSGIHSGLVLLDEGDLVRGRFEMLGNATNIARHLADVAQGDEILVSEETLGPDSFFFRTSERRYVSLKGRADPLAVFQVLARAPVGTRYEASVRRGLTPFVGREPELQALERSLREMLDGTSRLVALAAPAGLGKTRLAEEFLRAAAARGCQVRRGYCESELSAAPLQPFLQILRSIFKLERAMSGSEAAEAVEAGLAAIDPGLLAHRDELLRTLSLSRIDDGEAARKRSTAQRTILALRALFDTLAAAEPQVVFIDDWQWADDATREVLEAIHGLEQRPILLLIATRDLSAGEPGLGDARVLELAPLSDDETARTIGRLLPRADPVVVTKIRQRAGGNPLYIEELCHSAAYEHAERGPGAAKSGSAWLDMLIESRLARLPEAQAEVVRAAAVIGNVVPAWLLESITGCGEGHPLVRGLAAQDFVYPSGNAGSLRFKHGITRDVIYDSVGLHQRRAMHLRIAAALLEQGAAGGQEEVYEALAYHFGAGGQAGEAARYAELAGDKAVAASALDRAQTQYRAALAALDRLEPSDQNYQRWSSIAQRFGLVCVFDPSREQLDVLRRAIALAAGHHDEAALARAEYWLGYVNYALGESRVAIHHLERALEAAGRAGDDALIVQVRATLGQARAAAGDYEQALALLDGAIAVRRSRRTSARPAVGFSYTLACKAAVLGDRGQFAQAQACFEEALDAVKGANHEVEASVLGWRSAVYLWQGRWDEARQSAADAQRVAERVKSRFIVAADRALGAYAIWSMQRTAESLQTIVDATAWLEARERRLNISLNYGWLADAMAATGRYAELRGPATRALQRARRFDRLGLAMTYRALARASASGHGARPAEHYLARAMQAARARGSRHEIAVTQLCGAEIAARGGSRAEALQLLEQAAAGFDAMQMAWHLEEARRLSAQL